jgi:hypothetical protein
MRAVKAANADVDYARDESCAVVGGHRDPAQTDLGEMGLAQPDRKRTTHGAI